MISHAVAHVAARHAAEQQGRATLINMAALPLTVSLLAPSTVFPGRERANPQQGSPASPLSFLEFSRADVEEADWLGLQYLYKAGYDPTAMVVFFQKVATPSVGGVSESFSTHPQIEDRIAQSLKNIRTYLPATQQNVVTTAEFQEIKNRLLELKPK
jgi:predicted Zn-dependent protease